MIVQGYIKGIDVTTGEVFDLPYASVRVKGTTNGITANDKGYFSINVPVGSVLLFSFTTMKPFEKLILANDSVLNVVLEAENIIPEVEINITRKKSRGWLWAVGGLALASLFLIKPENPKKVTIK